MSAPVESGRARRSHVPLVLAAIWVALLIGGMVHLWRYKSTPGTEPHVPFVWPRASSVRFDGSSPTLVMFVHPCCPCTRASLTELQDLLPYFAGRLSAHVLAFRPAVLPVEWDESALHGSMSAMDGAVLSYDTDGHEAARFGVTTSGHVLLYGANGALRFSGGISAARGHLGDNPGLDRLRAALESELRGEDPPAPSSAPVFGCALTDVSTGPREQP